MDLVVVHTVHGYSQGPIDHVLYLNERFPAPQVIAGNIAPGDA